MKKWMIGAVTLGLLGLLAVNGTFASVFDGIFQTVTSLFGNGAPETSEALQIDNSFLMRDSQRAALIDIDPAALVLPAVYDQNFDWQPVATQIGQDTYQLWPDEKVNGEFDRFLRISNEGEADAFFRTAIAYPASEEAQKWVYFHLDQVEGYLWSDWADITIGGAPYRMIVATYQQRLKPGEAAPIIPMQLALDSRMENLDTVLLGGKLDLQTKTMAIGADDFVHNDEAKTPMTANEALDLAVPLPGNINQFNPF